MTTLAELLNQRKAAFERLHEAQRQIASTAVVEEPDLTDEVRKSAEDLVNEVEATAMFIQLVTTRINLANQAATIHFEAELITLMEAIALRDRLQLVAKTRTTTLEEVEAALGATSGRRNRWYSTRELRSKDDIKVVSAIDVKAFRAATKRVSDRVRALDIEIQKSNWSFEVA